MTTLLRWTLAAGVAVALLVEGYGAPAVAYVLGPRYADTATYFAMLAWATGPYAAAIVSIQALNALGQKRRAAAVAAIMAATHIALLAVLFSHAGVIGACLALIAGALLGCAIGASFLGVATNVRGLVWWLVPLIVTATAAALMRLVPVSAPLLALPLFVLVLVALAATRVIAREELAYIGRRFARGATQTHSRDQDPTRRSSAQSASNTAFH